MHQNKGQKAFFIFRYFLPVYQTKIIFLLVAKLPKTKVANRAIRTLQIVCGNKIRAGVRQSPKCLVQTLIFDEKIFFAKAEFKNFISEKEKILKEKNRKTRIKNFKKKIWLSRSKYLSLHCF